MITTILIELLCYIHKVALCPRRAFSQSSACRSVVALYLVSQCHNTTVNCEIMHAAVQVLFDPFGKHVTEEAKSYLKVT